MLNQLHRTARSEIRQATGQSRKTRARQDVHRSPNPGGLTFKFLCWLSPRLKRFHKMILMIRDDGSEPYFCANEVWALLRDTLDEIVGFHASEYADPRLRTSAAFDVARRRCYSDLPDCRSCGCVAIDAFISDRLQAQEKRTPESAAEVEGNPER